MSDSIFDTFNDLDDSIRMLCIDAIAAGIFLVKSDHKAAGEKLIFTALKTANLSAEWMDVLLENKAKSLAELPAHSELNSLLKK